MKILSIFIFLFGFLVTMVGILPFIFPYPTCDYCSNSGPQSFGEMLLMLSYSEGIWIVVVGALCISASLYLVHITIKST